MKNAPVALGDVARQQQYARSGVLGETDSPSVTVTLPANAQFAVPAGSPGRRIFAFITSDNQDGNHVERHLRLAHTLITLTDINAYHLAAATYAAGEAMAADAGVQVTIRSVSNLNWTGLQNKDYGVAAGGLAFRPGEYNLSVTVSQQAADTARRAEMEHEDDFERAFDMTYGLVASAIEHQAQRRYTLRSTPATLRFDSSALDQQEAQHKRMILQAVTDELRRVRPELLPANSENLQGPAELMAALEAHWGKCHAGLADLSKIRDYNRSHTAAAEIVVGAHPVQQQPAQPQGGGQAWVANPLNRPAQPAAARQMPGQVFVNPLAAARGAAVAPLIQAGNMTLNVPAPNNLLGQTDKLISFDNPFFQESYNLNLTSDTQGVKAYRW